MPTAYIDNSEVDMILNYFRRPTDRIVQILGDKFLVLFFFSLVVIPSGAASP